MNGTLFFTAIAYGYVGLCKSDGTAAGTVRVRQFVNGADSLTVVNGRLFLNGTSSLWTSDGTTAGTVLIQAFYSPGGNPNYGPYSLTNVNGTLFFAAEDVNAAYGIELWKVVPPVPPSGGSSAITPPGSHPAAKQGPDIETIILADLQARQADHTELDILVNDERGQSRRLPTGASLPEKALVGQQAVAAIIHVRGRNFRPLDRLLTHIPRPPEINGLDRAPVPGMKAVWQSVVTALIS